MRNFLLKTMSLLVLVGAIIACNRDNNVVSPSYDLRASVRLATENQIVDCDLADPLRELREQFGERYETFSISSEEGGTIETSKGSKIEIPAENFVNLDGSAVQGKVDISLMELKTLSELLINDWQTGTDEDEPLITFGSFDIQATSNGQPVNFRRAIEMTTEIARPLEDLSEIPMWDGDVSLMEQFETLNAEGQTVRLERPFCIRPGMLWKRSGLVATPITKKKVKLPIIRRGAGNIDTFCRSCPRGGGRRGTGVPPVPCTGNLTSLFQIMDFSFDGASLEDVVRNTVMYWQPRGENVLLKLFQRTNIENNEGGYFRSLGCNGPGTLISVTFLNGKYYLYYEDKPDVNARYYINPHEVDIREVERVIRKLDVF